MPGSAPAFIIRPSVRVSVCPCVCVQYCVFADRPPDKLFSTLFSTSEMSSTELRALFRAFIRSSTSNGMSVAARIGAHSARDGGGRVATRSELATSSSLFPHAHTHTRSLALPRLSQVTRSPTTTSGNTCGGVLGRSFRRRAPASRWRRSGKSWTWSGGRERCIVCTIAGRW